MDTNACTNKEIKKKQKQLQNSLKRQKAKRVKNIVKSANSLIQILVFCNLANDWVCSI